MFFDMVNFISSDGSVQLICFFLIQFLQAISLYVFQVANSVGIQLFIVFAQGFLFCFVLFFSFFGISVVSVGTSPSISYFVYFFFLSSLLLLESGQRCMNFVYLFKEPALGFIDCFLLFFESIFY